SHDQVITEKIRRLLELSRLSNDRTTSDDADWVEEIIAGAEVALRESFVPCFVMEDYKEQNAVFRKTATGWEVSGVFDLMQCHFRDGEADLSRTAAAYLDESPSLAAEFLRAYLSLKPPRHGFRERFAIYMLLDRMIIWEYVQRSEPDAASRLGS